MKSLSHLALRQCKLTWAVTVSYNNEKSTFPMGKCFLYFLYYFSESLNMVRAVIAYFLLEYIQATAVYLFRYQSFAVK